MDYLRWTCFLHHCQFMEFFDFYSSFRFYQNGFDCFAVCWQCKVVLISFILLNFAISTENNELFILTGLKGQRGPRGGTGFTGVVGNKGEAGDTGPTGNPGLVGDLGPAGPQGPRGLQGQAGSNGQQGQKGIIGDPGSSGPKGKILLTPKKTLTAF